MVNSSFIGIEIGGTKLQIVSGDSTGTIRAAFQYKINWEEGANAIRLLIEKTLKEISTEKTAAVGIGFGGPVNWQTGEIARSFQVEGWKDFNLKSWIGSLLDVPVFADNDANVAALGEAVAGAGKSSEQVLYLTLGSGVGGGFTIDKKIFHGQIPGEIEIGHFRLNKLGTTLESQCSGWAVDRKIRESIKANPEGKLAELAQGKTSGEAVFLKDALLLNDHDANRIFETTCDDLAFGISHAVHILHPDLVVLGGGLSFIGDLLAETVSKQMPSYLMDPFKPGPPVLISSLKEMAVPAGALIMAGQMLNEKK